MNKSILFSVSCLLILTLCFAGCAPFRKSPSEDVSESDSFVSDSETSSEQGTESTDPMWKTTFTLEDLDFCYVNSEYGDYRLGLVTEKLKAHTKYWISWKISTDIVTNTVCYFAQADFDGIMKPYVVINPAYGPSGSLGSAFSSDLESQLFENELSFSTLGDGNSVVFFPLAFSAANAEQAAAIVNSAKPYFLEVTIMEAGVG